ncbi:hypothetical protein GCM10010975_23140 [Comamonas phosphati]|nr:hypothetical protein GCM10010975_23140 [Comamonas phosphati]
MLSDPASPAPAEALHKLDELERNGLSTEQLSRFTELFSKASSSELAQSASAPGCGGRLATCHATQALLLHGG